MKRHGDGGEKGFWVSGYGRRTEKKGKGFGEDEEAGEGDKTQRCKGEGNQNAARHVQSWTGF